MYDCDKAPTVVSVPLNYNNWDDDNHLIQYATPRLSSGESGTDLQLGLYGKPRWHNFLIECGEPKARPRFRHVSLQLRLFCRAV